MFQEAYLLLMERPDFFLELIYQHLAISLVAILFASLIGLILGVLISEHEKTSRLTLSVVNFLYTIPSLALLGLLIPFTGVGPTTAIIALIAYGLLPMVKNTHTGIASIDPAIIEAAQGMGSTRRQILFKIKLPLAFPVITSGFRNMVTMTISLTSIAAFIGAGGLGVAIFRGITTNNMPMVLVGSVLAAILAVGIDLLLGAVEKRLNKQQNSGSNKRILGITGGIFLAVVLVIGIYSFALNHDKKERIVVASKAYTEQLVVGEILTQYLDANTDYEIELVSGISGGTSTIQPGIVSGEFDLYVEYTGTAWNSVLFEDGVYQETQFEDMQKRYHDMGLTWQTKLGFNNTYGIAVRSEIAKKYGLETYSDLVAVAPELTIGAEYDFYERQDGFYALCDTYGMSFKNTVDLDTGLKYKAIAAGEVDALIIYETDGQLATADVKILKDDKTFFPSYQAGVVVRKETLEKYPGLTEAIMVLEGSIDGPAMTELNNRVDAEGEDPAAVAHDFLVSKNLL